jgi:replicative DNA helicase
MNIDKLKNLLPIRVQKPELQEYLGRLSNGVEFKIASMPKLNKIIGGLERKKLVVVGARPSECKSAFCCQVAYDLSKDFKVLYISLEMTIQEMMFRMLCYKMGIPNTELYNGNIGFHKNQINDFYALLDRDKDKLIFADGIGFSWNEMNDVMEHLKEDKPDIVIVDYLQCIKTQGRSLEAIEDYIKSIRELAVREDMLIILASQINRASISESKEPKMEGLKGSGKIEEQADKVILLHYPCKHDERADISKFKIIVAKNKNGMTGYVDMKIKPECYKIYSEEPQPVPAQHRIDWNE